MGKSKKIAFGLVALSWAIALSAQEIPLTLENFLDQITRLDWLWRPPLPGEKQIQFSSYDRKSKIVDGKKINWFANVDAGNYLKLEKVKSGKEYVMADFKGPGVIVRIWSANPGRDRWRIYLDDNPEPVIDEPGKVLRSGRGKYFKKPFAGKRNMGYLLIFPIPFQKSCKVCLYTLSPTKPLRYYQIDIISLAKNAQVKTFTPEDLKTYQDKIKEVKARLNKSEPELEAGLKEKSFQIKISPQKEQELFTLNQAGVIKLIELQLKVKDKKQAKKLLNRLILKAGFDNLKPWAIYSPLGAFFGSTPGVNPYQSLPLSMDWEEKTKTVLLKSYWQMPFKKKAQFQLANLSDQEAQISGKVLYYPELKGDFLHFHCTYHNLENHPTRPFADWELLKAEGGAGRYVGTMLSIRNPDYIWWGEGDEKVFVDDDKFPSIFGTGTEDYFSYAWGTRYLKFVHPYYGMTKPGNSLMMLALLPYQLLPVRLVMANEKFSEICSQYRWQILDQIPFHNLIEFNLEIWHWTPTITFDLQATSYWYGDKKVKFQIKPLGPETLSDW